RAEQAERAGDAAWSTDRRDDRGHVWLDAVALGDIPMWADITPKRVTYREICGRNGLAHPARVAHGVGALDHRDVDRRLGGPGNAEVGRLAGGGDDALEGRL